MHLKSISTLKYLHLLYLDHHLKCTSAYSHATYLCFTPLTKGSQKGSSDAAYIYEELIDKYGGSPLLFNGLAVAKMHQGQHAEAEAALQQALTKVSGCSATFQLHHLIACVSLLIYFNAGLTPINDSAPKLSTVSMYAL